MDHVHVFAYGSNMSTRRMCDRVPSARAVGTGYVLQRRLAFHKRGVDGSAKADARFSSRVAHRVWGVVYRLRCIEKPFLDRYETLGMGYDQLQVDVVIADSSFVAWMYVARQEAIDSSLLPYSWYLNYIIRGAREHRLPRAYVDALKRTESQMDPDRARHQQNCQVIQLAE